MGQSTPRSRKVGSDVGGEDGWTASVRELVGGEAVPRDGEACGIVGRVA